MNTVLYDSDKCVWKRDFGYDSMSLKEFDEYDKITYLRDKYFTFWIVPGFSE